MAHGTLKEANINWSVPATSPFSKCHQRTPPFTTLSLHSLLSVSCPFLSQTLYLVHQPPRNGTCKPTDVCGGDLVTFSQLDQLRDKGFLSTPLYFLFDWDNFALPKQTQPNPVMGQIAIHSLYILSGCAYHCQDIDVSSQLAEEPLREGTAQCLCLSDF